MANLKETAEWVDGIYQIEKTDPVVGGEGGISNRQAEQLANRTAYLKQQLEKRATTESPTLTGTPKAPTPAQTVNDEQIATTAFVKAAIAALVGSAPATLDTLAEIATALGNDGNLKQVLLGEIGKKVNLTDFTALKDLLVGIPFPYPLSAVPSGCLAFNGQAFSTSLYPKLAQKYPSGRLPDLRGEFIRGWDNGRGVDSGRNLLSAQGDAIRNIKGDFHDFVYQDLSLNSVGFGAFYQDKDVSNMRVGAYEAGNSKSVSLPSSNSGDGIYFDASRVVPTANENRPRNIAFQYICLAA
ncbi:TPA: phage tail protein [Mannheimia haemolytica]